MKKEKVHTKNIIFLKDLFKEKDFNWIDNSKKISISFFNSGGGTHLYLICNDNKKFLARINFFDGKNEWGVKQQEFDVLKLVETSHVAPKVYYFNKYTDNELKQDLVIVEYINGDVLEEVADSHIVSLARDMHKLHITYTSDKFGDGIPPSSELPYKCDIYDTFADGDDKKIENYIEIDGVKDVVGDYNRINKKLGNWFNDLTIFDNCNAFSLCHADLKKENIIVTEGGTMLIDWECATYDITESDIGRLFSGCRFTNEQQLTFLNEYYGDLPNEITLFRITAIKMILDFFRILEDYILHKRKSWNPNAMRKDLKSFEELLDKLINNNKF